VNVNTSRVQEFKDAGGSNGACSLSNCSTVISMGGYILSALDQDSGEASAGEDQDLFWLGWQPIFQPDQATNCRCPSPTTTRDVGLSSEFALANRIS
jgi:hypothetical protein